ncbi:MAG: uracil-DNA glycosylase family protein [Akkermansiaceae bacterium]|nr:uracil-DNA glycosylase family protein [Akkermansiaceae bacterium]
MANPSSTSFDKELALIPHYQAFPAMLPYVGGDFGASSHWKMLLIGESFYFPPESTIHLDAARWYSETQNSLNADELEYFNCRGLLECPWKADGHQMYREINRCLDSLGLECSERAVSHVAFTNSFCRPAAKSGDSFKHCCTELDRIKSQEVTKAVIDVLNPDLVVYVSKYAWDCVGHNLAELLKDKTFRFASHPAGQFYWNRRGYAHGRPKFIQILQDDFMRLIKD